MMTEIRPSPKRFRESLLPFGSVTSCIKCGETISMSKDYTFYHSAYYHVLDADPPVGNIEFIVRACSNCSYSWNEKCKDAKQ